MGKRRFVVDETRYVVKVNGKKVGKTVYGAGAAIALLAKYTGAKDHDTLREQLAAGGSARYQSGVTTAEIVRQEPG